MSRKLNLQTIFNKAYRHFVLNGGEPAVRKVPITHMRNGFKCCYEYRGKQCAIGCALPKGHAARKHRGTFPRLVHEFPELFTKQVINWNEKKNMFHGLGDFQSRLHDGLIDKETLKWKEGVNLKAEYEKVAADYGLTVPVK